MVNNYFRANDSRRSVHDRLNIRVERIRSQSPKQSLMDLILTPKIKVETNVDEIEPESTENSTGVPIPTVNTVTTVESGTTVENDENWVVLSQVEPRDKFDFYE